MAESSDKRLYSKHHTWVLADATTRTAIVGITDYLTDQFDGIESLDMPEVGDELEMDVFGVRLHLLKRIHPLRSPLSGRITEINTEVLDTPSLIHLDPFKNWLFKMEYDDEDELDMMMDSARYSRYVDRL